MSLKKREKAGLLIIAVLVVVGAAYNMRYLDDRPAAVTGPVEHPKVDKSEAIQEQRLALIQRAVNEGYFSEVQRHGDTVRVYVKPTFMDGDFKSKQNILSAVYAYYSDDFTKTIRLIDFRTNKTVGSFTPTLGLRLD